jgi:hypothetical protein
LRSSRIPSRRVVSPGVEVEVAGDADGVDDVAGVDEAAGAPEQPASTMETARMASRSVAATR